MRQKFKPHLHGAAFSYKGRISPLDDMRLSIQPDRDPYGKR